MPNTRPFVTATLLCAAQLLSGPAIGQSVDEADERAGAVTRDFDEIVVVAHKNPRAISDVAASIAVFTSADIEDTLSTSVADTFRYAPGIDHEASGTRFGTAGLNLRGIGGNRVAMLIDGVPVSDQFDVGSFSNATRDFVNTGLVDRIEILHGPASALYGSAAIGGVVAASTPDPRRLLGGGPVGGEASLLHRGADASEHVVGIAALGSETRGLLLAGSLRDGEETDSAAAEQSLDSRDYRRQSLLAKWVADDRLGHTWRLGFIHQDADVQSDLQSMLGSGRFRRTTAIEGDDDYSMQLLNVSYEFDDLGGWIDTGVVRAYALDSETTQETVDERGLATRPVIIDRSFSFEQSLYGAEVNLYKRFSTGAIQHNVGFGIESRRRKTTEIRDARETGLNDGAVTNVLLGEVFPLRDFPISRATEWGAYLEDTIDIADWSLVLAARYDRYSLDPVNDPIYEADFPFSEPVALTESDLSPKLGVIYHVSEGAEIYLQYAHGFRAPPYADANIGLEIPLFNVRAIPNPGPEVRDFGRAGARFPLGGERLPNSRLRRFRRIIRILSNPNGASVWTRYPAACCFSLRTSRER